MTEPTSSAVRLHSVSKRFRLYHKPIDRLLDWTGIGGSHREFWALREIDLDIPRGKTFGIIGPNGAGKSTLLKIIAGTLAATSGDIEVNGRVAALLELGTGFHPEFTGRQNIRINGQLLGLSPEEIAAHEEGIIAFSELGPFIDQPIRTYSSGMIVRLGFSIAASVDPQVLIVDEALSVGDARFSQKCIRRIRAFRESGATILFVSHDPVAVSTLCDEAVLLDQGRIVSRGAPQDVLERYGELIAAQGQGDSEMRVLWSRPDEREDERPPHRFGSFQAVISRLRVLDAEGTETDTFVSGTEWTVALEVLFLAPVDEPTVGFVVRDRLGVDLFGTNTRRMGVPTGRMEAGQKLEVRARIPLPLAAGDYSVTVAVHEGETHLEQCYDWVDRMQVFRVRDAAPPTSTGTVVLPCKWEVAPGAAGEGDLAAALGAAFPNLGSRVVPAEGSPSPFVGGFFVAERNEAGEPFVWAEPRAVVAIRPSGTRLAFAVGRPPVDAPTTRIEARLAGGEALGGVEVSGSLAVAEFTLPEAVLGKPCLVELTASPAWAEPPSKGYPAGRQLALAVYAVETLPQGAPTPEWSALTAGHLSATSSVS